MTPILTTIVTLVAGGAFGAVITLYFGLRRSFWSRFAELEQMVIQYPALFPLWDHCSNGDPSLKGMVMWESSCSRWDGPQAYMARLDDDNRVRALLFVEMWGDMVIESNTGVWRTALGTNAIVLSDRAREVARAFDVFPADDDARTATMAEAPLAVEGRNGFSYSVRDLTAFGSPESARTQEW